MIIKNPILPTSENENTKKESTPKGEKELAREAKELKKREKLELSQIKEREKQQAKELKEKAKREKEEMAERKKQERSEVKEKKEKEKLESIATKEREKQSLNTQTDVNELVEDKSKIIDPAKEIVEPPQLTLTSSSIIHRFNSERKSKQKKVIPQNQSNTEFESLIKSTLIQLDLGKKDKVIEQMSEKEDFPTTFSNASNHNMCKGIHFLIFF